MVNSLTQAVQFGLRDAQANGKDFEIVVPLYSELMAAGAGANIKGILGSMNWNWQLPDEGTAAFAKSFGEKYGRPPSGSAHTCYVQTLLYADAVTRAGSFTLCVAEALEGFEFDGMGNGPTLYRAEDHQCFKDVLVVRGAENPTTEYDTLEIVEVTPVEQVDIRTRPPDVRRREASLGPATTAPDQSRISRLAFGAVDTFDAPLCYARPQTDLSGWKHGRNLPSNSERARQGLGLCADRAGPDTDLWHAGRGQLCPRRAVHDRRVLRRHAATILTLSYEIIDETKTIFWAIR